MFMCVGLPDLIGPGSEDAGCEGFWRLGWGQELTLFMSTDNFCFSCTALTCFLILAWGWG